MAEDSSTESPDEALPEHDTASAGEVPDEVAGQEADPPPAASEHDAASAGEDPDEVGREADSPPAASDRSTVPLRKAGARPQPPTSSLPTQLEPDEVAVAYLSCPPLSSVPLVADRVVLVGRDPTCDMVLPHESVSREHLVVRVVDGQVRADNRSSYGVYVNEAKLIDSRVLAVGDEVVIGPYHLLITGEPVKPLAEPAVTRPFGVLPQSDDLQGRIRKVPLAEVLQQLEFNQKTGTLSVFGQRDGTLVLYEGVPMHARLGDLRDDEAVIAMIFLSDGSFSFTSKVEAGEKSMSKTLTALLLEARRREDETD